MKRVLVFLALLLAVCLFIGAVIIFPAFGLLIIPACFLCALLWSIAGDIVP